MFLALFAALLAGCAATGEARRGEEPLRPVGDLLAQAVDGLSLPWQTASSTDLGGGPIVQVPAGGDPSAPVTVRIAAGGVGVSLRSDCADSARAGGAWTENTTVEVVEYGSGRCEGWTRVRNGNTVSWVRDEYLQGLPAEGERTQPAAVSSAALAPAVAQHRDWTTALLDGAGRLALLARHSPESKEAALTVTFIDAARDDLRQLARDIEAAAPSGETSCDQARTFTIEAANALAELADRMRTAFTPDGDVPSGLEAVVARYANAQREAARLITECAST